MIINSACKGNKIFTLGDLGFIRARLPYMVLDGGPSEFFSLIREV